NGRTGKHLRALPGPAGGPSFLLFAHDGKSFFTAASKSSAGGGAEAEVVRQDVATGQIIAKIKVEDTPITTAVLSRDEQTFAVVRQNGVVLVFNGKGDRIASVHTGHVGQTLAFTPDEKAL